MRCVVTGAAGFIGSHLCERLLAEGHQVVGVDAFVPYYPRPIKETHLAPSLSSKNFTFHDSDLRSDDLSELLQGSEVVFHLAAMAGLPKSWTEFHLYEGCNVAGTFCLLDALRGVPLTRFIHISTSSVYGRYSSGDESLPTRPISPYGVTKLASENLSRAFADEHGLPLVVLRYFSVYGPRQRPDMGYYKFIDALLHDRPVTVTGDGHQMRSNTFISDCVEATLAAVNAPVGETYNVGGDETASVWDILNLLASQLGCQPSVNRQPARPGDQRQTAADTTKLRRHLGWQPRVCLDEGIARQIDWQRAALRREAA